MAHQTTRTFLRAKIHRATVTDANLNYRGSIAICRRLMALVGIEPFEMVHVNSMANGKHWETYVIESDVEGEITLHGPPAHFFSKGDQVVINCWGQTVFENLIAPKVLMVDGKNYPTELLIHDFTGEVVGRREF